MMRDPTKALLAAALVSWLGLTSAAWAKPARARAAEAAPAVQAPSETVAQMAEWAIASGDHSGLPFAIIDKVEARIFVYGADGQLRGQAPVLIGYAKGDNSTPGVGDREMSAIRPSERTTPAGRFVASFGSERDKPKVLWVDYSTAISLHPVVTAHPKERRPQRLQSPTPRDNRITYGCINVSNAFYRKVVLRTFTGTNGIVYILPEKKALAEVFPAFRVLAAAPTVEASASASETAETGSSTTAEPAASEAAPPAATDSPAADEPAEAGRARGAATGGPRDDTLSVTGSCRTHYPAC
jgi:hypothetical protein